MGFRDDLKAALGDPLIDIEMYKTESQGSDRERDHFDLVIERALRVIRTYLPMVHIISKPVPSALNGFGEGNIDVSAEGFLTVTNVYSIKPRQGTKEILLPWSVTRIWEQVWVGKTDFLGFDLLLYQNELDAIKRMTNTRFDWRFQDNKVYVTNVPSFATAVGIEGLKGVDSLDDLPRECIYYEYALKYAQGLAKQMIGNIQRKFRVDGLEMPGAELVAEGKEEEKEAMLWISNNAAYPGGIST